MTAPRILEVAELDFRLGSQSWPFRVERAEEIAAHWEKRRAERPALYDGRVLLLGRHEFSTRADGTIALSGEYFETDFSALLAWRDFGFPDTGVCNGFSMAALLTADGAFVLGEMGEHTSSAGAIYFAAGTPDRQDLVGDRVDLEASVTRELEEETGIRASDTTYDSRWIVVYDPPRVACMKIMRLGLTARAAKARIEAFLASEDKPELAGVHVARGPDDLDPARAPAFVREFLRWAFAQSPVG